MNDYNIKMKNLYTPFYVKVDGVHPDFWISYYDTYSLRPLIRKLCLMISYIQRFSLKNRVTSDFVVI